MKIQKNMKNAQQEITNVSDLNVPVICLFVFALALILFFVGDPDLMDGIIQALDGGN